VCGWWVGGGAHSPLQPHPAHPAHAGQAHSQAAHFFLPGTHPRWWDGGSRLQQALHTHSWLGLCGPLCFALLASGPDRQTVTPQRSRHDCIHTFWSRLSGRPGAGPRSLGLHTRHTHHQAASTPTWEAPTLLTQSWWAPPRERLPLGLWLLFISTAPHTAVPAKASGTFNPLHKVLCILQSLYLCTIGPTVVLLLARDTPGTSNCSLKQLYSWMQPAEVQAAVAQQSSVGDSIPLLWSIPGHLPGATASPDRHCQPLHSPQHWVEPRDSRPHQSS